MQWKQLAQTARTYIGEDGAEWKQPHGTGTGRIFLVKTPYVLLLSGDRHQMSSLLGA